MKVLITGGGTSENIDKVRTITNFSTGRLGSIIADIYNKLDSIEEIYYIHGKLSILPSGNKIKAIQISDVNSLELAIKEIAKNNKIDIIIHTIAVSDYRLKAVTSSQSIADFLQNHQQDFIESIKKGTLKELIEDALVGSQIVNNNKIGSNIENMILVMEQTQKVISNLRALFPESIIVGFKLLCNTTQDILIDTAYRLLQANKCNYVLANDLENITTDKHIGYLIDSNKNYICYNTKQEIADGIVQATLNGLVRKLK